MPEQPPGLLLREDGITWLRQKLREPVILTWHNAPFDMGVSCAEDPSLLPLVFDAYREGRIVCTIVRQQVLDVALGMRKFRRVKGVVKKATYGLADLVDLYFGEYLEKADTWRLRYAELEDVPLEDWPPEAVQYAIGDAVQGARVYAAQGREMQEIFGGELPNQREQQQAAWALHLMSMWGVRADEVAVDRFIAHCEEEIAKMHDALKDTGIFKNVGGKVSRTMKEIMRRVVASCERQGVDVPMTDPSARFPEGQVKTDKETLEGTDDDHLLILAESMAFSKHLGQWGPVCRAAIHRPVCARYNVLVDNGRTSCSGSEGQEGTNMQNPPRKGDVRPCFIPRKGWVFCSTDADTIELRALAQNCLEMVGWSRMAEVLWDQFNNGGPDLHVVFGAAIAGITPAEAHALHLAKDVEFANVRQTAKHVNFGLAGGMGAAKLVLLCHGFGIRLGATFDEELARAKELKALWLATWPEMREYFQLVSNMIDRTSGRGTITQLQSLRVRGDANYTAAANTLFSGRVADGMKEALVRLAEECYTGRLTDKDGKIVPGKRSILYGSRPGLFLHDEPILEHPMDGTESDRAERQRVIVVESLQKWMKDVPITSTAILMLRWQKGADALKVDGKLVPVRPEKIVVDGKERVKWVQDFGVAA